MYVTIWSLSNRYLFFFVSIFFLFISILKFIIKGIFEVKKEDYDTLKVCQEEIFKQCHELDYIFIDDKRIKVEIILSADMKYALICKGLKAATSNYPCSWCTCHKDKFYINANWHIQDTARGARSYSQALIKIKEKKEDLKMGYNHPPLTSLTHVVDLLHLFLRITDVLFNKFENELSAYDNKQRLIKVPVKDNYYLKYAHFLKDTCKITHPTQYNNDSDKITIRKLSGGNKKKILEIFLNDNSIISNLFPGLRNKDNYNLVSK